MVLLGRASSTGCPSTTAPRASSWARSARSRPRPRDRYVYYPDTAEVPESVAVDIGGRSYTIAAAVDLAEDAEGALFVQGGVGGGHALYIQDGRCTTSTTGSATKRHEVVADDRRSRRVVTSCPRSSPRTGDDATTASATGTLTLYVDDEAVGSRARS